MSINSKGTLALIANRADNSISVVSIEGEKVKLIDTVAMGESVAAVKFTPMANGRWLSSFRTTRWLCWM